MSPLPREIEYEANPVYQLMFFFSIFYQEFSSFVCTKLFAVVLK